MTTWLITGCSSGLGRALAVSALARGHNVVITAREVGAVQPLADENPDHSLAVALDVTDPAQVQFAVAAAIDRFGGIDVLVNNAGYGYRAAVEEGDIADVESLFAVHFFGAVALIKAVLPQMRERHSGTIINLSSIGATITAAGSGYYSAAKSAVEGMTGALRKELEPLGIAAMVIEPGAFRTDFSGRSLTQSFTRIGDYADTAGKRRPENDASHGTQAGDPVKAGETVVSVVESGDIPELLLLGGDAVKNYRTALQARLASLEQWRELSESTDIETGDDD